VPAAKEFRYECRNFKKDFMLKLWVIEWKNRGRSLELLSRRFQICSKKIITKQLMTDIEEAVSVGRDAINLRKGGRGAMK